MNSDQRIHPRIKPKGMQADLIVNTADQEIILEAEIIDISYSGIRVKLKQAIAPEMTGNIRINMILPESNAPFSIHGILKHSADAECGLHYLDHP